MRRVFLGLYPPRFVQEGLAGLSANVSDLPARWTLPDQIHATLVFLGNRTDKEIKEIARIAGELAAGTPSFEIAVSSISWGPDERRPRMIWARLNGGSALQGLQQEMEHRLHKSPAISFQPDGKAFTPHMTLARLKEGVLSRIDPADLPVLPHPDTDSFPVREVRVMESVLSNAGAEHILLHSLPLHES